MSVGILLISTGAVVTVPGGLTFQGRVEVFDVRKCPGSPNAKPAATPPATTAFSQLKSPSVSGELAPAEPIESAYSTARPSSQKGRDVFAAHDERQAQLSEGGNCARG